MYQNERYAVVERRANKDIVIEKGLSSKMANAEVSRLNKVIGDFSYYAKKEVELDIILDNDNPSNNKHNK